MSRRLTQIIAIGSLLASTGNLHAAAQSNPAASLAAAEAFLATNGKKSGVKTTASGLEYKVLKLGKGPKPTAADKVRVNYKGMFLDGRVFDQSKTPIEFGVGQVIPGWTEALQLMPVGSRFKLWIHPHIGYGDAGAGDVIPPNTLLVFEVELLGIVSN